MKKEVVIAIVIGFGIGLLLTVILHAARKDSAEPVITPSPESTETPVLDPQHTLTILNPQPNTLSTNPEIELRGQTSPDSMVVIISDTDETIVTADSVGNFSAPFTLALGPNTLYITSYSQTGETATQILDTTHAQDDESADENSEDEGEEASNE